LLFHIHYYRHEHAEEIEQLRNEFEQKIKNKVPIANKFMRMKEIQKQLDKINKQEHLSAQMVKAFVGLLEQARREMEGFKTGGGDHPSSMKDFLKYSEGAYDRVILMMEKKENPKVIQAEVVRES